MISKPEIERCLVVSTKHISQDECARLDEEDWQWPVARPYEEGFYIRVPTARLLKLNREVQASLDKLDPSVRMLIAEAVERAYEAGLTAADQKHPGYSIARAYFDQTHRQEFKVGLRTKGSE